MLNSGLLGWGLANADWTDLDRLHEMAAGFGRDSAGAKFSFRIYELV
jgi:hypothetical protein